MLKWFLTYCREKLIKLVGEDNWTDAVFSKVFAGGFLTLIGLTFYNIPKFYDFATSLILDWLIKIVDFIIRHPYLLFLLLSLITLEIALSIFNKTINKIQFERVRNFPKNWKQNL